LEHGPGSIPGLGSEITNMANLTFSYNWNNKLNAKTLTTIRIWQPQKYMVGKVYSVYLQEQYKGEAKLVHAQQFGYAYLTEGMALIDTGYTREEVLQIMRKMYDHYIRRFGDNSAFGFYIFQWYEGEQKQML